jgi:flagellar biogenesis protein FliO
VNRKEKSGGDLRLGGLAGWLTRKLRGKRRTQPRLALVERITLAPRQSLSLVEAEGRRILVATSADGGSAFYALDETAGPGNARRVTRTAGSRAETQVSSSAARVSW